MLSCWKHCQNMSKVQEHVFNKWHKKEENVSTPSYAEYYTTALMYFWKEQDGNKWQINLWCSYNSAEKSDCAGLCSAITANSVIIQKTTVGGKSCLGCSFLASL